MIEGVLRCPFDVYKAAEGITMDKKKIITTVASVVAIVWIFCISFAVSIKVAHVKRDRSSITQPNIETTTAPSTTPTTTKPTTTGPRISGIGNHAAVSASVGDPQWLIEEQSSKAQAEASKKAEESSKKAQQEEEERREKIPKTKQEIIDAYTVGVNNLKAEQNFTMGKNDTLEIAIDDITGGALLQGAAENMMKNNEPVPESYKFVGGKDEATGMKPTELIAPLNIAAAVNPDAVTDATVKENSDGGFTVHIALIDELQTMDAPAPNHNTMVEVVREADLAMAGMTITKLDITYSGAYVEATFNKDQKIVSMYHYLPVSKCVGEGKLMGIPGEVLIHGLYTSTYNVSY